MSILISKDTRVICQGVTGAQGTFHTEQALCEVAHSKHIPCADGGILSESVAWMVYFHYLDAGQTSQAQTYEQRAFANFQKQRLAQPSAVLFRMLSRTSMRAPSSSSAIANASASASVTQSPIAATSCSTVRENPPIALGPDLARIMRKHSRYPSRPNALFPAYSHGM